MSGVLVLGGNRFMGRYLTALLSAAGQAPVLFNRGNLPPPPGVETVIGDRSVEGGLSSLAGRDFDAVVDLSAYKSSWVETALRVVAPRARHYVFVSSGAVYRPLQQVPWNEETPLGPDPAWGVYGREKVRSERLLADFAEAGHPVTIVRPPFVLGPENYADRESFVFSRLLRDQPILLPGGGRSVNQYVHAADVAAALVALLSCKASGLAAYNVGLPSAISNRGFVELCAAIAGVEPRLVPIDAVALGVASPEIDLSDIVFPFPDAHYMLDCSKLARDTGFVPAHSLDSTLREFFAASDGGARLIHKTYARETRARQQLARLAS